MSSEWNDGLLSLRKSSYHLRCHWVWDLMGLQHCLWEFLRAPRVRLCFYPRRPRPLLSIRAIQVPLKWKQINEFFKLLISTQTCQEFFKREGKGEVIYQKTSVGTGMTRSWLLKSALLKTQNSLSWPRRK